MQKPKSNVYTVMLALSLLAIILGCLFLYLELKTYQGQHSPQASMREADLSQPMYAARVSAHRGLLTIS